jgi:hypothetical protein
MIFRPFAVGSNYPSVSGVNSNHSQGVERPSVLYWIWALLIQSLFTETGNMLIMTYAYARASGDGSVISRYVRQRQVSGWRDLINPDSIRCFLPGPTIWMLRRYSLPISKLFFWVDRLRITDNCWWRRSSADNLSVNNQTNLAIKGIIAIKAMSNMSSVVNKTADANKYSVCTGPSYDTQCN